MTDRLGIIVSGSLDRGVEVRLDSQGWKRQKMALNRTSLSRLKGR